ncbi:MAG: CBS domain-containing protein [Candidatus Eisenbacteria bacterium]|nr:CBS domain-containing protein [Candidatus Eisenbacteria bacterium]
MATPKAAHGVSFLRRRRGIPLFTVFGIRIIADYSWFLIVALIAVTLSIGWFPTELPGRSPLQYWLLGLITALFFFASVLVHELSHSVVAVLRGIPVRRITLFLFGGVAEITKEPTDPSTELRVAIAGPAMSAVLAAGFWISYLLVGTGGNRPGLELALMYLAWANSLLLAFNLLPGLPLDGGRIVRALLWKGSGSLRRATLIASTSGKVIAGLLAALGVLALLTKTAIIPGLWFIFIALFLSRTADTSYKHVLMREALRGISISSIMVTDVVAVPPDITLSELIDSYLLRHHYTAYPVVESGRPLGVISVGLVKRVPRATWRSTTVREAMQPVSEEIALSPDDALPEAMHKMSVSGLSKLLVIEDEELVGVVTKRDIATYLQIRSDLSR